MVEVNMSIPRFYAQITTVSAPKMVDYEYEQNRSIYKTLKEAGERINNTFFEMVAQGELAQPSTYGSSGGNTLQDKTYYERYKRMQEETSSDKTLTKVA